MESFLRLLPATVAASMIAIALMGVQQFAVVAASSSSSTALQLLRSDSTLQHDRKQQRHHRVLQDEELTCSDKITRSFEFFPSPLLVFVTPECSCIDFGIKIAIDFASGPQPPDNFPEDKLPFPAALDYDTTFFNQNDESKSLFIKGKGFKLTRPQEDLEVFHGHTYAVWLPEDSASDPNFEEGVPHVIWVDGGKMVQRVTVQDGGLQLDLELVKGNVKDICEIIA